MNKSVYIKLFNLQVLCLWLFFSCKLLTFKSKHSFYFTFNLLEVGQQRPLQIKTPYWAGIRTRGRLPAATIDSITQRILLSQIKCSYLKEWI